MLFYMMVKPLNKENVLGFFSHHANYMKHVITKFSWTWLLI